MLLAIIMLTHRNCSKTNYPIELKDNTHLLDSLKYYKERLRKKLNNAKQ